MALKENYTFKSSDDAGTTIHAVKWTPEDGDIKAAIQLNHGMIEYIERYSEFAEFLADRGFVVMGHDHIGHGDSVASEADWGIVHTSTPSDTLVEDMFTNYKIIKDQYPDVPFFVFGHSMGSYLLRKFLCVKAAELKGVSGAIICGTGTVPTATVNTAILVDKLITAFKGPDYRSKFLANASFGKSYKPYDMTGEHPENSWLSKNVESVKKYYTDPKDTFLFSNRAFMIVYESCKYDNDPKNIEKMRKDMPLLVVSGADDPVGDAGVGTTEAYEKYKAAGISDITLKLFDGDRHEILQETDRQDVFAYIYDWMTKRM